MAFEQDIFEQPREFYHELHKANVAKAKEWAEGKGIIDVSIPETDLESHFEAIWEYGGDGYRDAIERWRGDGELKNLVVIKSEETGAKSYVVDTSDLVIGKPADAFFFYMVGKCWAVIVDLKDHDEGELRVAYHLPGVTVNKDSNVAELISVLKESGRMAKLTILYNSKHNPDKPRDVIRDVLPEGLTTQFVDMNELDNVGCHDLLVTQNKADQYYNRGLFDEETKKPRINRLHSGEWKID